MFTGAALAVLAGGGKLNAHTKDAVTNVSEDKEYNKHVEVRTAMYRKYKAKLVNMPEKYFLDYEDSVWDLANKDLSKLRDLLNQGFVYIDKKYKEEIPANRTREVLRDALNHL